MSFFKVCYTLRVEKEVRYMSKNRNEERGAKVRFIHSPWWMVFVWLCKKGLK
jgi:hypothetical protein